MIPGINPYLEFSEILIIQASFPHIPCTGFAVEERLVVHRDRGEHLDVAPHAPLLPRAERAVQQPLGVGERAPRRGRRRGLPRRGGGALLVAVAREGERRPLRVPVRAGGGIQVHGLLLLPRVRRVILHLHQLPTGERVMVRPIRSIPPLENRPTAAK
eukprot:gene1315-biopygen12300